MITYVRGAGRRYHDDLKEEKEASDKRQKLATQEVEASRIRKLVCGRRSENLGREEK